jgi:IstB-like ATP binding protein
LTAAWADTSLIPNSSANCRYVRPFEWGTVFPDPRLIAAIVDRVTFNAHILETGTQSYRLRTSKSAARGKTARPAAATAPS